MATIRDLITGSLRLINVVQANETPSADDMNVSFEALNSMIQSWSNDRLYIYSINPHEFAFVPNQNKYTLGPGGDWNITRPMEVLSMYVRYPNVDGLGPAPTTVDLPMEKLTMEQWSAIGVKGVSARFPLKFYDDGNNPLRTIYVWPVPQRIYPAQLWLFQPLIDPATIDDPVNFPKGYERALRFALAIELASEFGKEIPDTVRKIARNSMATIKRLNSQPQIMAGDIAIASNKLGYFNWVVGDTIPSNM